jgi:phosphoglycerate dehydrogenase-like enzyme
MSEILVVITVPFADPLVERLRAVSPRLKFHMQHAHAAKDIPLEILREVEVLYTVRTMPEPEMVPNLRWIQFHYAGVNHVSDHPLVQSHVLITTLSGVAAPQMAEFAVMCMLALGRRLPGMIQDKEAKRWAEDRFERFSPTELHGATVGIVGYGSIGREVARLCRAFGAKVLAVKRDLKSLTDPGYVIPGLGDPAASLPERLYPPQALRSMAGECDFVVVATPLTDETRGLVDRKVLQNMKPTAYLVDISRGGVVDHGALVEALNEKRIAGAALDVYPVEPLPESSPLWEMPNVILSPHVGGASGDYMERAAALFAENLRRYVNDEPLLNRYDPSRGY